MKKEKRIRRHDPLRTGPIRNWSALLRQSDSWSTNMTNGTTQEGFQGGKAESLDDALSRSVELGYKVIEEQIQQGQKLAGQFATGNIDPTLLNGSAADVGGRVLRFYTDIGALWYEMVESMLRKPGMSDLFTNLMPDTGQPANGAAQNGTANGRSNIHVEIISAVPTGARVSVELHTDCDVEAMLVQSLHAREPEKESLTDVQLLPPSEGWSPTIQLKIPNAQPAGTYSGLILSAATDEPVGTICVHIPSTSD